MFHSLLITILAVEAKKTEIGTLIKSVPIGKRLSSMKLGK